MSDKRFYWFKMESSFFEQKEIKYLRRLPGGDTYTIIYLKLILKSLENNGKIYYENIGDNYTQEWSLEIEEDEQAVNFLVGFLINKGLMIDCGSDEFEIAKTKSLVGSETSAAERKRRQRERLATVTAIESVTMSQVGHIEIEKEKEIEIEIESESEREDNADSEYKKLTDFYQVNFGVISQLISEDIKFNLKDYGYDLVHESMKRAIFRQKQYAYSVQILKSWSKNNIKSLADVEADDNKFNKSKTTGADDRSDWTWAEKKAGFREV